MVHNYALSITVSGRSKLGIVLAVKDILKKIKAGRDGGWSVQDKLEYQYSIQQREESLDKGDVRHICGICGNKEYQRDIEDNIGEGGFCAKCAGDHFVSLEDLDNPELKNFVRTACGNLSLTKEKLRKAFKE